MASQPILEAEYISASDGMDSDTAAEFSAFIDEMQATENADAWITVLRIPVDAQGNARPNSKASAQLFQEPMGARTISDIVERVRSDFIRPGETTITVRIIGSQKGQRGLKFNKIFTIERANAKTNEPGGDKLSDLAQMMINMQRASDERMERILAATQSARVTQVSDPIEQMTKMMTAMGAMMGPMMSVMAGRPVGNSPDPADSLVKLATTMKTLDGLFGGKGPPEDDGAAGILKAIAGIATPAIQLMAETKRNETERLRLSGPAPKRPSNSPPKTAPKPAPAAEPIPNSETPVNEVHIQEDDTVELAEMKKNLDTVCDLRDSGKSPEQVAKLVLATVPQENDDAFLAMLDSDDYVPNMTLLNPRVGENVEWANALRAALLAEYEPDSPR